MGNIALNKYATASGYVAPYSPSRAVDGSWTPASRWLCTSVPCWMAVDLGQIILLFTQRQLVNYQFEWTGRGQLNSVDASVYSFRQVGGAGSVTIFAGRLATRETLQGEVWVRESDCLPLRISIVTQRELDGHFFRDEATVDYSMSPHAVLLPASVVHREYIDGRLENESLFRYAAFRRFSAEADIKFTSEPPQ